MYLKPNHCLFSNAKKKVLMHYRPMKSIIIKIKAFAADIHKRHTSKKLIGLVGVVTQRVQPGVVGEMRLTKPVAGKDRWVIESQHQARMGRLVKVIEVRDCTLVVERFNG